MKALLTTRLIYLYIFLFCVTLLAIAMYMQQFMLLEPCPLCINQRIFFAAAGLTSLLAFIHNPKTGSKGTKYYGCLSALFAIGGACLAMRQIWLQHLPKDQIPSCGPSLGYMFKQFPLSETLSAMFTGDGNCAEVLWRDPVIGMNIPEWSLTGFIMLTVVCLYQAFRK